MATHSSILALEIPWTEEPGGLQSMGSQKSWTRLSDWTARHKIKGLKGLDIVNASDILCKIVLRKTAPIETLLCQKSQEWFSLLKLLDASLMVSPRTKNLWTPDQEFSASTPTSLLGVAGQHLEGTTCSQSRQDWVPSSPADGCLVVQSPQSYCLECQEVKDVKFKHTRANSYACPLPVGRGTSGKEPACQGRSQKRHGFPIPWVRKIPWKRAWQPTPILACRIAWTEKLGGLQSMGLQRVRQDRSGLARTRMLAVLLQAKHLS